MKTPLLLHILGSGITAQSVKKLSVKLNWIKEASLEACDWVISSPGIPPDKYPITNKPILSEIELAYRLFKHPKSTYCPKFIGITGTNGKSTIAYLLEKHSGFPACGNYGTPLIDWFNHPKKPGYLIVELSSFQLYGCEMFCPDIAIFSSFNDDHLSWHQTSEHYKQSKLKLVQNITNQPILLPENLQKKLPSLQNFPNYRLIKPDSTLKHLAKHLQNNISLSNACLNYLKINNLSIKLSNSFQTLLPHRLERVKNKLNRIVINDSKATNPESSLAALDACKTAPILILCGQNKQLNLNHFLNKALNKSKQIVCFGELSAQLKHYPAGKTKLHHCQTINEAIKISLYLSKKNDIILFSPSSSSYDQFKSFEERGTIFKQLIQSYEIEGGLL